MMQDRREFLAAVGAALAFPKLSYGRDARVSSLIDHIILGCSELYKGVEFVSARTGVRATFGGVHPGGGTRNALLRLGERQYLEILAPDPDQPSSSDSQTLRALPAPRLMGWAVHTDNIKETERHIRSAGLEVLNAKAGSRRRPDGRLLSWRIMYLRDNMNGLLPLFFVEWDAASPHPSLDAPRGCDLTKFEILAPNRADVEHRLKILGLDTSVIAASPPHLRVAISGPQGILELSSLDPASPS